PTSAAVPSVRTPFLMNSRRRKYTDSGVISRLGGSGARLFAGTATILERSISSPAAGILTYVQAGGVSFCQGNDRRSCRTAPPEPKSCHQPVDRNGRGCALGSVCQPRAERCAHRRDGWPATHWRDPPSSSP